MAYTYIVGWKNSDRWYYGYRWVNRNPKDDLWVRYFTSSKIVKAYVEKHGNPDVIKISREFADSASARNHESRFLKRVDAKNSDRWLNQTNGGKDFCTKPGRVKTDSEKSAARSASLGLRAYHKEGTVKKFKENPGGEWIKGYPENHHGLRGTKASLKAKENMKAAWINREKDSNETREKKKLSKIGKKSRSIPRE